ncbi:hypothetical protein [Bailinhaonella thermotolerans]|nr:hypothetical protein [Bailinhaonella thermotolerans]
MGLAAVAESLPYVLLGVLAPGAAGRTASFRALAGLDLARALLAPVWA